MNLYTIKKPFLGAVFSIIIIITQSGKERGGRGMCELIATQTDLSYYC